MPLPCHRTCGRPVGLGQTVDTSAVRRRYQRAQDAADPRPLRWRDLRHTYEWLLAANSVDLVTI